ncbi:hypothetical protein N9Y02_07175 [Flavobacteriaceae bacterium]|nr:hypothetical protein [Flavobacteriaceae bacterium]
MLDYENLIPENSVLAQVFETIFPDIFTHPYNSPYEFIQTHWAKFLEFNQHNRVDRSTNGAVFEALICIILIREGIQPIYTQAEVTFVPNARFDILVYSDNNRMIALSLKTTLRERWKQADLEAFALKNVHRTAKSYLITLSEAEARNIKSKINSGGVLGLDDVIVANKNEFDGLIKSLKTHNYTKPGKIAIIKSSKEIGSI